MCSYKGSAGSSAGIVSPGEGYNDCDDDDDDDDDAGSPPPAAASEVLPGPYSGQVLYCTPHGDTPPYSRSH